MRITEKEKAYLAGFFDGEGCVYIGKQNPKHTPVPQHILQVIISQSNESVMRYWQERLGVGVIKEKKYKRDKRKNSYQWFMSAAQAEEFLRLILPYLRIKAPQAEIALEYRKTKGKRGGKGRGIRTTEAILKRRDELTFELKEMKKNIGKHE